MKKPLLAASLVALLASGTAIAGLQRADADGDGSISRAEFVARADARFARLDTDRNGQLAQPEMESAREAMRAKRAERMEARGKAMPERANRAPGNDKRFARLDVNSDGALSLEEHRAQAVIRFDRMDANRDGQIDKAERQSLREKMKDRRAARQS